MKETFQHLSENKKTRVINACISEFGDMGYDLSSTSRIIKKAGISKGGLYEYISSKEELYLFTVEYAYDALYQHIEQSMKTDGNVPPDELLERVNIASQKAISFYLENPDYVRLIVKAFHIHDSILSEKVSLIFQSHFDHLFGDADTRNIKCNRERMIDLVTWILLKTRYDFLLELDRENNESIIRDKYRDSWEFYLSVLRSGLY